MKFTFIPIIFILSINSVYSQSNNLNENIAQSKYWSIEFTGGSSISFFDKEISEQQILYGFNSGINIFYKVDSLNAGFGFLFKYNRFNVPQYNFYNHAQYYEFGFAARFYVFHHFFIEPTLENYAATYSTNNFYEEPTNSGENTFGLGFGIGGFVPLSKNIDVIFKAKIHKMLQTNQNVTYVEFSTGLSFGNKNENKSEKEMYSNSNRWSLTYYGGINNPEYFNSEKYIIGFTSGMEAALRMSHYFEIFGGFDYNNLVPKTFYYNYYDNERSGYLDVTVGPRFYMGGDKLTAFFEGGVGLYSYFESSDNASEYLGANFGSGLMYSTKYLSFILKSNLHFVAADEYLNGYFTTKLGVKLIL